MVGEETSPDLGHVRVPGNGLGSAVVQVLAWVVEHERGVITNHERKSVEATVSYELIRTLCIGRWWFHQVILMCVHRVERLSFY